ncbi:uncharacterized protein LOC141640715 [Silene latifolia]|uniref:uncharacterized protein LOC141640715 n=1 Tax=Silene latifolia TaxID=37657 RepID=UPI003D76B57B
MKAIAWNCRGLNNPLAPTIVKLRALISNDNSYDLVFISETKCNVSVVSSVFRHYGFLNAVGVDALDTKGGLWVGWRSPFDIECIAKSPNYVILRINECSSKFWYFCCVNGAPEKANRMDVWLDLEEHISRLDSYFVMLGDFNQIEFKEDKIGGSSGTPFGAQAFSEWMVRNSLMELAYKGPKFTWCNNRKGKARIYERLDKGLVSSNWLLHFPNTGIKHLPIQGSDHAPIIMDTEFFGKGRKRSLKMEAWSFAYTECFDLVKKEWSITDNGSFSYKLMKKLKRIRFTIINWTVNKRKEWNKQWSDFDEILGNELEDIFKGKDEINYESIHENYLDFNRVVALFWKQRAKNNWIRDGDACTKFFFNTVMTRRNHYFKDVYGANLATESFDSFSNTSASLFSKISFRLNYDQQDTLSKPYTRKEVRKAVFQLGSLKSPGPDGIPALFYQKYRYHIKNEVTDAVLSMLTSGHILKTFNHTSIVLIPKIKGPEKVEQYRPISLCNVVMKIVTKCISNRLRPIMPFLVGDFQNGFIPGRNISDNVLISHELFQHITRKTKGKKGLLALKIDMSKAYDRLSWNFIHNTLIHMNFPPAMVSLIMNCITTVSYDIMINGSAGKTFRPRTGLRQGDPISPYIFALCTEVLSQMLQSAQRKQELRGIKLCLSAPAVSHLLFADDSIFFIEATSQSCQALKNILRSYCQASGQQINKDKSAISFSPNCTLRMTRLCMKILNVSGNKAMGKYLGLPTDFGANKKDIFALLIEKVRSRILSWNNNFLSPAGRLTLISSVLFSLSIYSLSAFKTPVSVNIKIDSLLSHFWWSGTSNRSCLHWCSKLFIHRSKSNGGLGIRNIGCLNQSLLAKVGWRILHQPTSLIGRTLGSKYRLTPTNIMAPLGIRNASLSWGARGILWDIDLLRSSLSWAIGFPSTLDVWHDKWIRGASLGQLLQLNASDLAQKPSMSVCQLQNEFGEWNMESVLAVCDQSVAPAILSITSPTEDTHDSLFWTATRNGIYSVKTGYSIALNNLWLQKASDTDLHRMEPYVYNFCKTRLWSLPVHEKWKLFLWKILSKTLPVGEEGMKRSLDWNYSCSLCLDDSCLETLTHLFRDCSLSSRIWAAFTLWRIWCIRNSHKFNGVAPDLALSMNQIMDEASMVTSCINHRLPTKLNLDLLTSDDLSASTNIRNYFPVFLIGHTLCSNYVRLKCDASWKQGFKAAAGWLIQYANGEVFRQDSARFWASSPLHAESMALLYAIKDAISHGFQHIDATTDCLQLVLQVTGNMDVSHDAKLIIRSIINLISTTHCISISYCPRQLNRIAHSIARFAMD